MKSNKGKGLLGLLGLLVVLGIFGFFGYDKKRSPRGMSSAFGPS